MGFVAVINRSLEKGKPVQVIESGYFIKDFGLEGDRHGGRGDRQVSFFGLESIERVQALQGRGLCTARFNENIITSEIRMFQLPVGTYLKIGETIQEITQVGKMCHVCEMAEDKVECPLVSEVVFTSVIQGGKIEVGNEIEVIIK